jgi:type III secretory pathway component EscR
MYIISRFSLLNVNLLNVNINLLFNIICLVEHKIYVTPLGVTYSLVFLIYIYMSNWHNVLHSLIIKYD